MTMDLKFTSNIFEQHLTNLTLDIAFVFSYTKNVTEQL